MAFYGYSSPHLGLGSKMRNQPATKSWKTLDAPGQVVLMLAGMMFGVWFLGTCIYFMIPQSGKDKAAAAKSKSAETENRQVASLESDSQSNLNETSSLPETSGGDNSETDSSADSNSKSNMLALDERETTPPIEEAREPEVKPEPKTEPESPYFVENKSELNPETETVPIPQPLSLIHI